MFDPVFYPNPKEDRKISIERARKATIYSALYFLFITVKVVILYEYVDRNSIIPQQWLDTIVSTCPIFKKTHLFHHFTLSHTGYVITVPMQYFWNYRRIKHIEEQTGPYSIDNEKLAGRL